MSETTEREWASLLPELLHPPGGFSACIPQRAEDRAAALCYLSNDINPNTYNMRFKYLKE